MVTAPIDKLRRIRPILWASLRDDSEITGSTDDAPIATSTVVFMATNHLYIDAEMGQPYFLCPIFFMRCSIRHPKRYDGVNAPEKTTGTEEEHNLM